GRERGQHVSQRGEGTVEPFAGRQVLLGECDRAGSIADDALDEPRRRVPVPTEEVRDEAGRRGLLGVLGARDPHRSAGADEPLQGLEALDAAARRVVADETADATPAVDETVLLEQEERLPDHGASDVEAA